MKKFILKKIQKGFTPMELLLVIGISAVVAGLFVFTANSPSNMAALSPINVNVGAPNITVNPPDVNVNVGRADGALAAGSGTCVIGPNIKSAVESLGKGVITNADSVCDASVNGCGSCIESCLDFTKINDKFGCPLFGADGFCNPDAAPGQDPDCVVYPTEAGLCSDGVDNDDDGAIDLSDSDCVVPAGLLAVAPDTHANTETQGFNIWSSESTDPEDPDWIAACEQLVGRPLTRITGLHNFPPGAIPIALCVDHPALDNWMLGQGGTHQESWTGATRGVQPAETSIRSLQYSSHHRISGGKDTLWTQVFGYSDEFAAYGTLIVWWFEG